jgi:PAS domain S-box-containing protein
MDTVVAEGKPQDAEWRAPMWGALVVGVTLALAGLLVAHVIGDSRIAARRHAEIVSSNLATVLRDDIQGSFASIDVLLRSTLYEVQRQQAHGGIDRAALEAYLAHQQSLLPPVISLRIADAAGNVTYGPGVAGNAISVADRPYFVQQRDRRDAGMVVGAPVLARISKQWALPISRRIDNADGTFAGVAYVNFALDHLSKTFSAVNVGNLGAVVLFDGQRNIFARYPEPKGLGSAIGLKVASPEITALIGEGLPEAIYEATATTDSIHRIYSYKKIPGYPLFIMAGLGEGDYLADWRAQRTIALVLYGAFAAVVVLISAVLFGVWARHSRALAELMATQDEAARTLAALQESDAKHGDTARQLRLVLETVAEGIVGIDGASRISFANPAAAAILGRSRAGMAGMSSFEALGHLLANGKPCAQGDCPIRRTLVDGETRRVENECFGTATGAVIPVEYTVAPMIGERGRGAVVVFHDISARRQMEADLQRSNAELEQFAYVTSHDLRQPLRMIASYLGLIERRLHDRMDADVKEFMDFAVGGAKRMDRLILDLLDYSRIGRQSGEPEEVALGEAVAESLANLEVAIDEACAIVTVCDGLPTIRGSSTELVRLMQNLVGNAVKYRAAERAPRIDIGCRGTDREWVLSVKDNGIGIAPENCERVFALFQRLGGAEQQVEGAGIGLAVCKKIVEHLKGRIWIESAPGEGSTFFVALPKPSAATAERGGV